MLIKKLSIPKQFGNGSLEIEPPIEVPEYIPPFIHEVMEYILSASEVDPKQTDQRAEILELITRIYSSRIRTALESQKNVVGVLALVATLLPQNHHVLLATGDGNLHMVIPKHFSLHGK